MTHVFSTLIRCNRIDGVRMFSSCYMSHIKNVFQERVYYTRTVSMCDARRCLFFVLTRNGYSIRLQALMTASAIGLPLAARTLQFPDGPCSLLLVGAELLAMVTGVVVQPRHCASQSLKEVNAGLHCDWSCQGQALLQNIPPAFDCIQVRR